MEGNLRENITFTQNAKKRGYETVIPLKFSGSFLVANALAADGTVLATTDVWDLALGATVSIRSRFLSDFRTSVLTRWLFLIARGWSCRLLQDRLRLSRRFRSHDCASRSLFWGASRYHVGRQEEDSVKLAFVISWLIVTAASHSIWALRRLHLFKAFAQETLPIFVDFPWRSGKRTGKDHAEIYQNIIAYPPSIKRRGVQGFWEAFGETSTARSGGFPPLTTAHAIIPFSSRSYCNRNYFKSTCSAQGTMFGCTHQRSERSRGPVVDGGGGTNLLADND